ncbi:hypothetical protein AB0M11_40080 [Streptomyces sp. NPDC051987]|uniref:hypothetical protein n=1 Tax=Streptomyces sp. NPDC051987 TaxID=3155808 RepID=UPI003425AABA
MGNSQSQSIIDKATKAAADLRASGLDERAIRRAETLHGEMLQSIREAGFSGERLAKVTRASEEFRDAITASRRRVAAQQAKRRAEEEERRRTAALDMASDVRSRRAHVEESLRRATGERRKLEVEWTKSLKPDQKNQHDVPLDSVYEEFIESDKMRALGRRIAELEKLLAALRASESRSQEDQLLAMDPPTFLDALDRAEHGQDPFPLSIPVPLQQAADLLRSSLSGVPDSPWDNAFRQLLDAKLPVSVILRAPVPDAATRSANENFVGREGGIWTETDALAEARRVFSGDALENEINAMIRAMDGGAGHGARLRSKAPDIVLAGNSAGFDLTQPDAFRFVNSVGIAWVSALSTSDSGGANQTRIRGEI